MAGNINKICGLWYAKAKSGKIYLRGNSKNGRFFMIFKNKNKREGKKDPDYELCESGCDDLQSQFTEGNYSQDPAEYDVHSRPPVAAARPAPAVQADPVTGETEDDSEIPF